MSDFVSLYTAFSGLTAAQAGINTSSHNVANAATPGYTRQQVELASRTPYQQRFGLVGQGVDVAAITRNRITGLDTQFRISSANQGRLDVLGDLLYTTETILGEPGSGMTASMSSLWDAFDGLALDPPNASTRQHVISSLEHLSTTISGIAGRWEIEGQHASGSLATAVEHTNTLLQEVASLNRQILDASTLPSTPNDLLDQRDLVMDELAKVAGVNVSIMDNGAARVSIDGLSLVSDMMVSPLSYDPTSLEISHSSGAVVTVGGELAGYQAYLQSELPNIQDSLNTFARELADAFNAQHAAGYTPDGSMGGDLLSYTIGSEAKSLSVVVTHHSELAAAGSGPPVAGYDSTNAEALSALRHSLVADGASLTIDDAMRNVVSLVGGLTASTLSAAGSQAALASAAENARMQAHGVSIDEEMVNLITYQRAYEAAARVMTAVDESLDTLINRTGLVGR